MKLGVTKGSRVVVSALCAATIALAGCGGVGMDTIDKATLSEGQSVTRTLKFWMKERGLRGEGLADNVHFDDAANNRIVLWYDAALKEAVAKLEQGKAYKVTFKYEPGEALVYGTMTKVE